MSPKALINNDAGWALFLDVDGTLLELAETPQDVYVSEQLKRVLNDTCLELGGAFALVSGRTLASLDALFAPYRFCAAGLHGFERRDPAGCVHQAHLDRSRLDLVREPLQRFVATHAGLLLEDKGHGLALHFRRAPQLETALLEAARSALDVIGPEFTLQSGKSVYELRPRACNKGTAVAAFNSESPFTGRTPVYVGDDLTDEDAFAAVNALGGVSIHVGDPKTTLARYRFNSVADVTQWLGALKEASATLGGLAARVREVPATSPAGNRSEA